MAGIVCSISRVFDSDYGCERKVALSAVLTGCSSEDNRQWVGVDGREEIAFFDAYFVPEIQERELPREELPLDEGTVLPDVLPAEDLTAPKDIPPAKDIPVKTDETAGLDAKETDDTAALPAEIEVTVNGGNSYLIKGGMIVTVDAANEILIIPNGQVYFKNDLIACVSDLSAPCAIEANTNIIQIPASFKVYPGLVDAHNHVAYNFTPLFLHPGSNYQYNGDWRDSKEYAAWRDHYYNPNKDLKLECQMTHYGIMRALAGGATTTQSISTLNKCFREDKDTPLGPRQIDSFNGITKDTVKTNSLGIGSLNAAEAQTICDEMDEGKWGRFFIHLGEGVQGYPKAVKEFTDLEAMAGGCLINPKAVFIHCSGFTLTQLQYISQSGAMCVWSPSSNTDLYGWKKEASLDVPTALALGIPLAMGPDWYASHGIGMVRELAETRLFAAEFFGGAVSDEQIFRMATVGGARAANLEDSIGKLIKGMKADVLVLAGKTDYAFEDALLGEVEAVFIDGRLFYGDTEIMAASGLKESATCEKLTVCGKPKKICMPNTYEGKPVSYSATKKSFFWAPDLSKPAETAPFAATDFDELPEACEK